MRTRLLFLLLTLILLSGCSSVKKSAVSSYSSVQAFLFPRREPYPAPSSANQWHLRTYKYCGVQTNTASREHARGR